MQTGTYPYNLHYRNEGGNMLTLKVLVATIDALGHFETG